MATSGIARKLAWAIVLLIVLLLGARGTVDFVYTGF
jgi:hypothetical protein